MPAIDFPTVLLVPEAVHEQRQQVGLTGPYICHFLPWPQFCLQKSCTGTNMMIGTAWVRFGWNSWARCQPSIPVLFWKDRAGIRVPVWALLHAASAAPQLTTKSHLAPLCTPLLSACGAHPHKTQVGGGRPVPGGCERAHATTHLRSVLFLVSAILIFTPSSSSSSLPSLLSAGGRGWACSRRL